MKYNQLKIGTVLSYVQMGLNIILNLVYTPIMIRLLGQNEYGLYQIVTSTISMLTILSLGFNAGYIRFFSIYKERQEQESIYKLNGLFLILFSFIGVVALGCGLFFTFHLELVFSSGFTNIEYDLARVLMALLTVNLTLTFPMSVFQMIITANERFIILKLIGMLKTVCSPLISIPLLLMGYHSIALVTVTVVISFVTDILYLYYVLAILKERFLFHGFEKGLFKNLFVYTSFIAMNIFVDQVNQNIDKVLLGRYQGTAETAVYSVGFTVYYLYQVLSSSISSVFTPRIHGIVARTSDNVQAMRQRLTELFIKVGRIQYLILALIATGFIFFGKPFILYYWAGNGFDDSYIVALLLILSGTIPLIQNLGIEMQRAQNRHQFRSVVYIVMAGINLVLSIYLCQLYGAIGCAMGTAISYLLANGLAMNIYYHKKCNINILAFWKNILKMSQGLIIPIACGILINICFDLKNIFIFLLGITIYIVVYGFFVWKLSMNMFEKELILTPIRQYRTKERDGRI